MIALCARHSLTAGLLFALCLVPCHSQPEDAKPWPLPSGKDAYVRQNFDRDCLNWTRALTVEAYQQLGLKNPAWDEGALKLLEVFCQARTGAAHAADVLAIGEPLVKAGCNDPLVLYVVAEALLEQGRPAEAKPLSARAVEGFQQVGYSKAIAWDAPVTLLIAASLLGKPDEVKLGKELSVKWLVQATTEPAQQSGNHRPLWRWLVWRLDGDQYPLVEEIHRALQAEPHAEPWFRNMIGGRYFTAAAWAARGGGYANTVTEQGAKTFHEDLKLAADCFTKAWELHREYPEAATEMIAVAMGSTASTGASTRRWFDRAVTAQFDWNEAYSSYEWALRPRWRGSLAQMAAFGEECLATARFDTTVPRQYLDLAVAIADDENTPDFWLRPGVYENLKRVCEGYAASPLQTAAQGAGWKSRHAAFAWRTGHYDDAARLLTELGAKLDETPFARFNVPVPVIRGQVLAATGAQATAARRAEELHTGGATEAAIAAFTTLADQLKDTALQPYLDDRLATLRMQTAFAKGEWVPLRPSSSLAGWRNPWGQWQVEADGTVRTLTTEASLLACTMLTGDAMEIEGTIELPGDGRTANAGVVLGLDTTGNSYWSTLQLVGTEGQVQWCRSFQRSAGADFTPTRVATVTLRLWQGHVASYVNGQRCFPDEPLYTGLRHTPGVFLGFGTGDYEGQAGVKYTNFRVRRLTAKPANPPVLDPIAPAATIAAAPAPVGPSYLFYEAEKALQAKGWNTNDSYAPSGGAFFYRMAGGSNATAHFDLRQQRPWAVWLRLRDETDGQREVIAKVNGKPSCAMGGTDAADWRWFQLSVADADKIDLEVIPISTSPMDAWIDAILITDDLGFIPPPKPPLPGGYTTYKPADDPNKAARAGWIWWPAVCAPGSTGFFRKSFALAAAPTRATLDLAASGAAAVWINMNKAVAGTSAKGQDITALLRPGKNQLAVQMPNSGALTGLKLRLVIDLPGGLQTIVRTDPTWKSSDNIPPLWGAAEFDDSAWSPVLVRITDRD